MSLLNAGADLPEPCFPVQGLYYRRNLMRIAKPMQKPLAVTAILILTLTGCSNLRFPGVYRIDIPQGNFVTSDMLVDLQPGMTPEQVRYVLGMPALLDPFTPDTWYYLMTYQPGQGEQVDQQIIVHFDNGIYSHYEGEVVKDLQRHTQRNKDKALQDKAERQRREDTNN